MKRNYISYDILKEKINGQAFYNEMMIRLVNPLAREMFRKFRDDDERHIIKLQKHLIAIESKPSIFKAFINVKKGQGA